MSAVIIGTNITYVLLTFLPPLVWLLFYLREDGHPEPKHLLLLAFLGGVLSAIPAIGAEVLVIGRDAYGHAIGIFANTFSLQNNVFGFFLIIALIEEFVKYLPVRLLLLRRPDFNEPVDAMIYMMTSALGFAAIENYLFVSDIFRNFGWAAGFEVSANRFLGANLLHALSSGIVGFFLARAFFLPYRRHFVAFGIAVAAVLHALFNYLILTKEVAPQGTLYIALLLIVMAVMVFIDFERLKKEQGKEEVATPIN